jgi:hypothetical protein
MEQGSRVSVRSLVAGLVIGLVLVVAAVYLANKTLVQPFLSSAASCSNITVAVSTSPLPGPQTQPTYGAIPEEFVVCGNHTITWVADTNIKSFQIHFTSGKDFGDGHYPTYTPQANENSVSTGKAPNPCFIICSYYYYEYTLTINDGQTTYTCAAGNPCTTSNPTPKSSDPRGIVMGQ